jgi:hypothetical protein
MGCLGDATETHLERDLQPYYQVTNGCLFQHYLAISGFFGPQVGTMRCLPLAYLCPKTILITHFIQVVAG